ncbi:MAG: hypothetical protein ABI540_05555 [Spartobacteria bacterium]
MKQITDRLRLTLTFAGALALLTFAAGCASTEPHANTLAAAGFQQRTADTPEKAALLKTLPVGKLTLITWKGHQYYVQPDGSNNAAWVGTPTEYQAYQQLRLAKQLSNDNLMAAQMNQTAVDRWGGVWGPGFYGGFYGRGYGWR